MSEQSKFGRERLHELLADRAVFGLSIDDERELQELLRIFPDVDADEWDRLAAQVDLATCGEDLPALPPSLVDRVQARIPAQVSVSRKGNHRSRLQTRELLAWLIAAACFLVAVYSWTAPKSEPPIPVPGNDRSPIAVRDSGESPAPSVSVPSLAQQMDELLASSDGILHVRLSESVSANDLTVSGEIVWSRTEQRGFLRLKGLPTNDPTKSQYQLWIVEDSMLRSETVNAGVFDVEQQNRELIVPIRADHLVQQPNTFVISIEPPGGSRDLTVGGYPLVAKLDNMP
ncbi:anti-sigma factor [Tuwongella immobilis]|uniref:Anti-sigma K factor RskA C-terminal domain-containing protein n=1 Tax=Tuwongella immobilis TaxID=692036 RepID=A0A6C2YLW5_9BACT|nr:anti-sigma factor [Tuwongella immobilis]VIP01912.1 anti-sigma factor : Uncharacterized protein OS=Pirellula staleyi (strain ATCC 27377 / DSM 6068 / ICPB 4128) GN=Psta_1179 PE=4 SV=1: RskA [Tuwongella immobilis]VTR99824.1 anti-sigma factor : Uncharacterized protein OS=Pirellula staleyi (strain ATCC 27377 / DSM 6068 / ICPB 4128) GN=Psta_1179 PE=4 SV=1: RskA [Tuwongella immobilis]